MSITINTKTYDPDVATNPNQLPYRGPAATLSAKDEITLARVAPKPTKDFSGMARSRIKIVKTVALTSALTPTSDITFDGWMNVPVGAASGDVDAVMADVAAAYAAAWAKQLAKNLDVTV